MYIYIYMYIYINIAKIRVIQQTREARFRSPIIESVDSISRDERGFPLTQYITNGRISRAG